MGGGATKYLPVLLLAGLMNIYFQCRRRRGVRPPPLAIPPPPPPPPPQPQEEAPVDPLPVDVFCCSCNRNRAVWAAEPCGHRLICYKCKDSTFMQLCSTCGRVVGSWKHMAWGPAPAAAEPPLDHDA